MRKPLSHHSYPRTPVRACAAALVLAVVLAGCSTSKRGQPRVSSTTTSTTRPTVATAPTTTTVPSTTYVVRPGDTLSAIAHRFHVAVSDIVARNHLANPDRVPAGQSLVIPPAPPLTLHVTPVKGQPGESFVFTLTGAMPSETIKFTIASPSGSYTGGPHTASPQGTVTATYQSSLDAAPGAYTITAKGNLGSNVQAQFSIIATTTSST